MQETSTMSALLPSLSRRNVLAGAGALIVSFSLARVASAQEGGAGGGGPPLPGSLRRTPMLDSWIRIDANEIKVVTGKVELGQGIKTALIQVAAEELAVDPSSITLITADTSHTPNEGVTSGSQSMQESATAIRHAAAQARAILVNTAATRFGLPADRLKAQDGAIVTDEGRSIRYGELVSDGLLHVTAQQQSQLTEPAKLRVIGKPLP